MTFIIALGVIIVLLCSASVFKLMQPKQPAQTKRKKSTQRSTSPKTPPPASSAATKTKQNAATAVTKTPTPEPEQRIKATAANANAPQTNSSKMKLPALLSLNLYADADRPYAGYELLQALLSCGMRFGAMNIFHRHEKKTGVGPVYFSLASCTQEGTFDLAKIGSFSCNGLVLFMKPQELKEPVTVFELMLETADQLIHDLGGKVLNAKQQILTKEDVLAVHRQLQHYSKDRNTMDLFD